MDIYNLTKVDTTMDGKRGVLLQGFQHHRRERSGASQFGHLKNGLPVTVWRAALLVSIDAPIYVASSITSLSDRRQPRP